MATIEPIMYLKSSSGYFGQQNLMETSDFNNCYLSNNGLNFTNGEGFFSFIHKFIITYLNHSNHNPEIIWRIRMKNKLMHVRSILTTWLPTITTINNNYSHSVSKSGLLLWSGFLLTSPFIFIARLSVLSKLIMACHVYLTTNLSYFAVLQKHKTSLKFSLLLYYHKKQFAEAPKHPVEPTPNFYW